MRNTIKKILKENDFDWIGDVNPVSKEDIIRKVYNLRHVGYTGRRPEDSQLTQVIYGLALNKEQIDVLFEALYNFGDYCHNEGIDIGNQNGYSEGESQGYDMGHSDGYSEAKRDMEDELEEKYEKGYDEGYDEAIQDGYQKGYEEGAEATYYKAFEEGRAYEAGIEVEDLERRESGFDPSEYDEDNDENY
jgi:flagellar biosynthesis/type III secretory pathway protein FliH